ncbi:MAG: hypothetical protein U9N09_00380 [Euryarchaeota archaeon]|nr:hypothetical protein [Euryarchaeota archaeon]
MPSKKQGEELRGIIMNIRDGTFEYESKVQVKTNWTQYDKAQIHEMANYLDNIRDLVEEADKRIKERTPPRKLGQADRQLIRLTSPKPCCYRRTWMHQIG